MSNYKEIRNGKGTTLVISDEEYKEAYISVGPNGDNVMIRGEGTVIAFPTWKDLISALEHSPKASYVSHDKID